MMPSPPRSTLFPYTTLFRSHDGRRVFESRNRQRARRGGAHGEEPRLQHPRQAGRARSDPGGAEGDRKSTRLNSSHEWISYAVFCLKKKNKQTKKVDENKSLK